LTGCVAAPHDETRKGGFVLTSNPSGAWVLVRDCRTCEDRSIAKTPYLSLEPARDLKGKYVHIALDGYAPSPIRHLRDTTGAPTERIHHELAPAPGTAAEARAASPRDEPGPLQVTSAELTPRYRSAISAERAVYEPLAPDTLFLVVTARASLPQSTEPGNGPGTDSVSGDDTQLLGPADGQQRRPILTHRRLLDDGVAIEHAFSVPLGRTGPYRLWANGHSYPLAVAMARTEEPGPMVARPRGESKTGSPSAPRPGAAVSEHDRGSLDDVGDSPVRPL
jgi:hypothetical protein